MGYGSSSRCGWSLGEHRRQENGAKGKTDGPSFYLASVSNWRSRRRQELAFSLVEGLRQGSPIPTQELRAVRGICGDRVSCFAGEKRKGALRAWVWRLMAGELSCGIPGEVPESRASLEPSQLSESGQRIYLELKGELERTIGRHENCR